MKGTWIKYTGEEMTWLEANRLLPIGDYHAAFCVQFQRDDVSAMNLHSLRKRKGWKTGRTGCFEKGHEPPNKGKSCPPGTGGRHPNAQRTQFRKGNVAHNFVGAGHERIDSKDGYLVIIVDEPNPWNGHKTRPVHKHRYLWEQVNGPIPEGHVLKCLDGNKVNCDPSNWELIPREVLPLLSARFGMGFDRAHPEVKPTIMAVAKLKHAAKRARQRIAS